ncbi:hypothetical protein [Nonomuraea sp. NPDC023979]|uniref:hypothetical protein n=1 Tax=Nonomuraea sp. NPDC023979 TaxID=3154796 RepID=UPI00340C9E8C
MLRGGLFVYADGDGDTSVHYMRLTRPMVLAPWEPWAGTPWITEPTEYDQRIIRRCEGKVFGPGVVVSRREVTGDMPAQYGGRWPYLIPAPDGSAPAALVISNGPVKQVKCKACGDLLTEPFPRPSTAWEPVRGDYRPSRRRGRMPTKPGPHPAGSPACVRCYPAAWPEAVQAEHRADVDIW